MARTRRIGRWGPSLGVALSLVAAGCTDVTTPEQSGTGTNLPAIGVTAQSVGFSVLANGFTFEDTYTGPTLGDSLVVGLAVVGYGGGSALVEVRDQTSTVIAQRTVTGSIAQGQTTVHGSPPYTVHVSFTGFTGIFALGVAAQTP